jgi:putative membrane protein
MRNLLVVGTILAVGGAVLAAGPARAQEKGSRMTRDYVASAAQSDAFEMLEAETALTQSRDPQVRAFAQAMLRDHGRTSQTLRDAAQRSGLKPPPMGLGADQAPLLSSLQSLRGPDFDKTYWRHQALGHRSALVTAQRYAAKGDDPAVRQAAATAVPIISAHLAEAERMAGGS